MSVKDNANNLTGTSVFGAFAQLNDAKDDQTVTKQSQSNLFAKILNTSNQPCTEPAEDPFRELVLSKNDTDPDKLRHLADRAANLNDIEEIPLKPPTTVKSIAGIFTGTDTFVKKVEETIKKKYAALEPSDSEGYGEAPLLGRLSRTRRAKSASQRSSAKLKSSDRKRLLKGSDSSSTETTNNAEHENSDLDYAADRIKQVKESILTNDETVNKTSLRPLFLDINSQNDDA